MKTYTLKTKKTLLKETIKDLNKWKEITYPWIGTPTIVKMTILPN